MMSMATSRNRAIGGGLAILLLVLTGCDSTPETRPMDEPIDHDAAMDVDAKMRQRTDELLKEHELESQD